MLDTQQQYMQTQMAGGHQQQQQQHPQQMQQQQHHAHAPAAGHPHHHHQMSWSATMPSTPYSAYGSPQQGMYMASPQQQLTPTIGGVPSAMQQTPPPHTYMTPGNQTSLPASPGLFHMQQQQQAQYNGGQTPTTYATHSSPGAYSLQAHRFSPMNTQAPLLPADPSALIPNKVSYGQKLMHEIFAFDGSWYARFIDYTQLRSLIKRIVYLEQNPHEALTQTEQSQLAQIAPAHEAMNPDLPAPSSSVAASSAPSTSNSQHLRNIFWYLLSSELSKIENVFHSSLTEVQGNYNSLAINLRFFDSEEAKERIRKEHESYQQIVQQQWTTRPGAATSLPTSPKDASMNGASSPTSSLEYQSFLTNLYPSSNTSPQLCLMFLQCLKESQPSVWSILAQNAKLLLPDLLSLITYQPEFTQLETLRQFLLINKSLDKLLKYVSVNMIVMVKLLKLYDFHTKRQVEKAYLDKIYKNMALFTDRKLDQLILNVQDVVYTKLLPFKFMNGTNNPSTSKFTSLLNDKHCQLCNNQIHFPILLRCQHRLCLTCISLQSEFGLFCPIQNCYYYAGKQRGISGNSNGSSTSSSSGSDVSSTTLDPSDLAIEPVLSRLNALCTLIQKDSPSAFRSPHPNGAVHSPPQHQPHHHQPHLHHQQENISPFQRPIQIHPHHNSSMQMDSPYQRAIHAQVMSQQQQQQQQQHMMHQTHAVGLHTSPTLMHVGMAPISQGPSPVLGSMHTHSHTHTTHSPGHTSIGSLTSHSHVTSHTHQLSPSIGSIGSIGSLVSVTGNMSSPSSGISPMSHGMAMYIPAQGSSPMQTAIGGQQQQQHHANLHLHQPHHQPQQQPQPVQHAQQPQQHHPSSAHSHHLNPSSVLSSRSSSGVQKAIPTAVARAAHAHAHIHTASPPGTQKQSCHACKVARDPKILLTCSVDPDSERRRKCRKRFCAPCISRLFGLYLERMTPAERESFICPTCLGCCVCAACKKKNQDENLPAVPLNPKTGLPLVSPYASSPAYSADGTFHDALPSSHGGDGLVMLATSSDDPFGAFRDREDTNNNMEDDTSSHGTVTMATVITAPQAAIRQNGQHAPVAAVLATRRA